MKLRVLFILAINVHFTKICLSVDTKILSLCTAQSTCENCLEASLACAWCSDWVNFFVFRECRSFPSNTNVAITYIDKTVMYM